jgi:hypothetical protein
MARLEYKYLIEYEHLDRFRSMIMPFLEGDDNAPEGDIPEYSVRSIYFDTPNLRYYHEKIEGLDIRKKLRVRGYNDGGEDPEVYLEIKRKNIQSVWKNRAPMKYNDIGDLFTSGDVERWIITDNGIAHAADNARRFMFHMYQHSLEPIVLVSYEREAYAGRYDTSLRITIDKYLRSAIFPKMGGLFSDKRTVRCLPDHFIVEVKFPSRMPNWIQAILGTFGARRRAVSKYCIGLDAHKIVDKHFSKHAIRAFARSVYM